MQKLIWKMNVGLNLLFVLLLIIGLTSYAAQGAKPDKMNVILILADDLGASDTSLGGSTFHQTPNLARLAERGMYFTNAYSASALCSPTRSSIMSGQSPARTGITAPAGHTPEVKIKASVQASAGKTARQTNCASATRLATEHITLAEVLKEAGYATAHFGKWHLGKEPYSPLEQGFDIDIPHWPGPAPAGSFVAPWKYPSFKEKYPKEHIEDRLGDEIVSFMEKNKDKPFYINYWQFSVHAPFDAKAELIEKYKKTVDPKNPQQSPTYAAMVQSLDDNIGKLLDALDRLKIADKTIIIFYSDNGGNMYNLVDGTTATSNAPYRGGKATVYEGGIHMPAVFVWPAVVKGGAKSDALIQSEDLYATVLDMVGLPAQPKQAMDSISAVPALLGKPGQRDAVYVFFPHGPSVPDHLPPSVVVRQGDWKLIRIFHDNPDQSHRYELYNLKEDIGERNNLAAKYPDRVKQLDGLLEAFLQNTHAVVPKANPNYDPKAANKAQDWTATGYLDLSQKDVGLQIRSFGESPMIIETTGLKAQPGSAVVEFKMRSLSASGPGRIYWADDNKKFDDKNAVDFAMTDDGLWHEYRVELPLKNAVGSLRVMPASTQGVVHIEWIRLKDFKNNPIKEWNFIQKQK